MIMVGVPSFEIELRARFDEVTYKVLKEFLDKEAEYLGEDDKDAYFLFFPTSHSK